IAAFLGTGHRGGQPGDDTVDLGVAEFEALTEFGQSPVMFLHLAIDRACDALAAAYMAKGDSAVGALQDARSALSRRVENAFRFRLCVRERLVGFSLGDQDAIDGVCDGMTEVLAAEGHV